MRLFLKNKNNFFAKNHCEIQVRTILVCTLYSIEYGITFEFGERAQFYSVTKSLEVSLLKKRSLSYSFWGDKIYNNRCSVLKDTLLSLLT